MALVLVVGVIAAWGVAATVYRDADRRERVLAQQTGNLTAATVQQLVAAISGASGLADDRGVVRPDAFATYATGVVDASPFETLAYVPVVTADERESFEQAIGGPIVDRARPGSAGASHLPSRPVGHADDRHHEPPGRLRPGGGRGPPVHRPGGGRAGRHRGQPRGTRTTEREACGHRHPRRLPGGRLLVETAEERRAAVVGFVVTGVQGEQLLEAVDTQLGGDVSIRVEDAEPSGDAPLPLFESDPAPEAGAVVERMAGGRSWRITVDDGEDASTTAPWWLLAATLALAGTLVVFAWRAVRHQRQMVRHVATVDHLATVGRSLGGTTSLDAVARTVRTEVPACGADSATLLSAPRTAPSDGEAPSTGEAPGTGDTGDVRPAARMGRGG